MLLIVIGQASVVLSVLLAPELVDAMNGLQNPKEKDMAATILKAMNQL